MPPPQAYLQKNKDLPISFVRSWAAGRKLRDQFEEVETYCMFIGYPRSGHSLAGSLLDAHPQAVISHELDALRYFRTGFSRDQVFALILENERRYAAEGRRWGAYDYEVPHQWQGRFERLRVIGDKKGGRSTRRMMTSPRLAERVRRSVGVPVRYVHVTRNPYDNIATMLAKKREGATLAATIEEYFMLCAGVAETKSAAGHEAVLDLRHESLIADPDATLGRLCSFLGLVADDAYRRDCASILFPAPRQTRGSAPWTPALIDEVDRRITGFDFLDGYCFGN